MGKDQVLKRRNFKTNREQRTQDLAIHFQKQIQQNEEVQTHPSIQGNQLRNVKASINVFCTFNDTEYKLNSIRYHFMSLLICKRKLHENSLMARFDIFVNIIIESTPE